MRSVTTFSPMGSTAPLPTNHLETWPDARLAAAVPARG
jgi:hypothetical protein